MASVATQTGRPMAVMTPLGSDVLQLTGFSGHEGLSQLFSYHLDAIADNAKAVPFDQLLGKAITVRLDLPGGKRFFNGICNRVTQGESDLHVTQYRLEVVPQLWLLTKRSQSRIFQYKTVEEILKDVLQGVKVSMQLDGEYKPRDFFVQYRETDFNFISRLMEEEGIYYYFKHSDTTHEMVLGDLPTHHAALAPEKIVYRENSAQSDGDEQDFIYDWSKTQEVTAGKYLLWDHCFELPHKHLESPATIAASIAVGQVTHSLQAGDNTNLELYDWPGEYAQRFDGIDRGGAERPAELQKIFPDGKRTATIRMQEEAADSIVISGASNCRHMVAGHKFTLSTLGGVQATKLAKADGPYVLTGVTHSAHQGGGYDSGDDSPFEYHNSFTCIPAAQPFRPVRSTPKPVVPGSQSAVVVGPQGEEIFTDKYGRVKVQFHWERKGKNNAESSCWIRVGTAIAGKQWGVMHIPRIGQEVIVDFLEGDPDQPIIVGSVFNAEQMPAYKLPDEKTKSYIKTNTSPGGKGFNEIRFEDLKGKEQIFVHAQRNMDTRVLHDRMERVVHDRNLVVGYSKDEEQPDGSIVNEKGGDQKEEVWQDKHLHVHRHQTEHIEGNKMQMIGKGEVPDGGNLQIFIEKDKIQTIEGNYLMHIIKTLGLMVDGAISLILNSSVTTLIKGNSHTKVEGEKREKIDGPQSLAIGGDLKQKIGGGNHLNVGGDQSEKVGGTQSLTTGADLQQKVGQNAALDAGQEIHIKAGMKVIIEAGGQLSLKGPGGFVDIGPSGVTIVGTIVNINSGGAAGSGSGAKPKSPEPPEEPDDAGQNKPKDAEKAQPPKPAKADNAKTGFKSAPE